MTPMIAGDFTRFIEVDLYRKLTYECESIIPSVYIPFINDELFKVDITFTFFELKYIVLGGQRK